MSSIKRSPLFYVGDKYKLMAQLLELFPLKIQNFYEPFMGGGTVSLNIQAKHYYLNDIDKNLMAIHAYLIGSSLHRDAFFQAAEEIIETYGLSRSYKEDIVPDALKKQWKKTYFARFNKEGYLRLREYVNSDQKNDPLILYLLLIYGFNRMLRFNGGGQFNLPVGNVDFNKNVVKALNDYFDFVGDKAITLSNLDYAAFLAHKTFEKDDFVYFDPPYLITMSEYNKIWNEQTDAGLFALADSLHKKGVKFALSDVTYYKGRENQQLISWMTKYTVHTIKSNYISYHNNQQKNIKEVLITNYANDTH